MSDNNPSSADPLGHSAAHERSSNIPYQPPADPGQNDVIRLVSEADPNVTTGVGPATTAVAVPLTATQRYTLGDEIARGGMGVIHRATDTTLGREGAVKVLHDKYDLESGVARRFADEARITSQLQHPSIPPVHDLGSLPDGRPFLAVKLIKGQTLEELLKDRPEPAAERGRFVAVFEQICQALAYAHSRDVIHRDLKPANVMVGSLGEVQVMDWGLGKVLQKDEGGTRNEEREQETLLYSSFILHPSSFQETQAGQVLGTPAFMPPEQAIGAVDQIDKRSDVFGLGSILCVILTGRPPFVGATAESIGQASAKGKLADAFARLDTCAGEPDLVALCKVCLAPEQDERPAHAGVVAQAVARLRVAAEERAPHAELERVRVEGEKATAEARAAERQKRRRLVIGAAAVLAVAVVSGLRAVLAVQRRANADLAAKNVELADEQEKVQARFEMAQKAIATFHTGVSEDMLLKNDQFQELRTKLLKEAAGFYTDLEKLLAGQTDAKSRKTLAEGYFQLAELTDKIGSRPEALAVHRKALALRRKLAAAEGADVETRLDVTRSLWKVGELLRAMGDHAGALAAFEQQRHLAQRLETEHPTDAVRSILGQSHDNIGLVLFLRGKPEPALESYRKALAIRQKLADANPASTQFQSELAWSHNDIGNLLSRTGKPEEALTEYRKALAIRQKLADANPAVTDFPTDLARSHNYIGLMLARTGKSEEALKYSKKGSNF